MKRRPRTVSLGGGRQSLAALVTLLTIVSVLAVGVGTIGANPTDEINYGDDAADTIWIDVDTLTVARHDMSEGGSDTDMAGYSNDEGDWVEGNESVFIVNTSIGEDIDSDQLGNRNPYDYDPALVDDEDYGEFPRRGSDEVDDDDENLASALDASEWSSVSHSGNVTVSDSSIAQGVEGVRFDTASNHDGDTTLTFEHQYNNWTSELDSDESKRVAQIAGDVDSIDADARVYINITDESGDYKQLLIEPDASGQDANASVMATGAGTFHYQVKLDKLDTNGGGSWDNIESIEVGAEGGDVDVTFSRIDFESKGKDSLGEEVYDSADDDDDDFDDTQELYNSTGTISVHSMETLGAEYDDAVINDVQFPAKFRVQDLQTAGDEEDYQINWTTSTKYTQPNVLTTEYRLELPAVIDLSYSGTDLMMTQAWPEARYVELGLVEGADGEGFESMADDDDYTSQLTSLGTEDEDVSLDTTVSSDTEYAIRLVATFSDAEKSDIESEGETSAGGGGAGGQEPGGILSNTWAWVVGILATATGLLFRIPQRILGMG